MDKKTPWIEKYRPKNISEISQNTELIELFGNIIRTREMTHSIFYGPPGTGKTSTILAIGMELFKDRFSEHVIEFNASDDRGINAVREKISTHAKKTITGGRASDGTIIPAYKIIILDEADSMTDEAQDALRVIIEKFSNVTRFCFICNYITKITDAIKSRCCPILFNKIDEDTMTNKIMKISKMEGMRLKKKNYQEIFEVSGGDMRRAIMILQNIKYYYNITELQKTNMSDIDISDIKTYSESYPLKNKLSVIFDVYHIAALLRPDKADDIIKKIIKCKNILQIKKLSDEIISTGYPVDTTLQQLNYSIINSTHFDNLQKAKILHYSGDIFYRIRDSGDEYLQLLNYVSFINKVYIGY